MSENSNLFKSILESFLVCDPVNINVPIFVSNKGKSGKCNDNFPQ